jgi:hypothetical protein
VQYDIEVNAGAIDPDNVYRALLTLPLALLPDLDVAVLQDPKGDQYRSFVDANFRDFNWGSQKVQILQDMEEDESGRMRIVLLVLVLVVVVVVVVEMIIMMMMMSRRRRRRMLLLVLLLLLMMMMR